MTSSGKKPDPLKPEQVREVVLAALSDEGSYTEQPLSLHARFDHLDRKIDLNDVIFGLKAKWSACKVERFDEENWQWVYEIKTEDIEGREFFIVLRLDSRNKRFHVITRYPND
jgi:hypothetical protein